MGKAIILSDVSFASENLGLVHIAEPDELVSIRILGSTLINSDADYSILYTPITTNEKGVSWSVISGNQIAEINSEGHLTIKDGASSGDVVIKATSLIRPSVSATLSISVKIPIYSLVNRSFNGSEAIENLDFSLTDGEPFTILFDVTYNNQAPDITAYYENIITQMIEENPYPGFVLRRSKVRSSVAGTKTLLAIGSENLFITSNNDAAAGSRAKAAFIFNPNGQSKFTYFVNGEVVTSNSGNILSKQAKLVIGAGYQSDNQTLWRFFNGTINELRIFREVYDEEYCRAWTEA